MAHEHELDSTLYDPVTFDNQNSLNLIIDERITYDREYIILDRDKISEAIADPDTILSIFNSTETKVLIDQFYHASYITLIEYNDLIINPDKIYDIVLMNNIQTILLNQFSYITKIPSINDLENNGLLDSIIKVIQDNPSLLINNNLVAEYTDNHLYERLKTHKFISFEQAEYILQYLSETINILKDDIIGLLNRVSPYLSFITQEKILLVQTQLDNNQNKILDIFNVNEIKMIIDKEIELKYLLLKILTPEKINEMFDKFKDELISININKMVDTQFEILKDEIIALDYTDLVKAQVDNYLTVSYNTLMRNTLENSFATFKSEFINITLKDIIKTYFDELSENLFGTDYGALLQAQINIYLENSIEKLTDIQMQIWIKTHI